VALLLIARRPDKGYIVESHWVVFVQISSAVRKSELPATHKYITRRIHMKSSKKLFLSLLQDESGQDLIEYALVAGLIGLAAVATMTTLGTKISDAFTAVGSQLTSAT
jgi:pilus assembly protein Flp/PilA